MDCNLSEFSVETSNIVFRPIPDKEDLLIRYVGQYASHLPNRVVDVTAMVTEIIRNSTISTVIMSKEVVNVIFFCVETFRV